MWTWSSCSGRWHIDVHQPHHRFRDVGDGGQFTSEDEDEGSLVMGPMREPSNLISMPSSMGRLR